MDAELEAQLRDALGADSLTAHGVISPHSTEAAATAVRLCAARNLPMRIVHGARDSAAPGDGAVHISLHRLHGITMSVPNLTLRADAGALVDDARTQAAAARLAVVGMPGVVGARTVAELIDRGEVPRRALCGIDAVLPTGEQVVFGGGVLKDVVGYDLPALLLGSMGRLAVLLTATFRLEPVAARTPVGPAPGAAPEGAHRLLLQAFDPQGLLRQEP